MTKATITINGRTYDAVTGLPITAEHSERPHRDANAQQSHAARTFSDVGPSAPVHELHKPERPAHDEHLRPTGPVLSPREVHAAAQAMHITTQRSTTLQRKALKKPEPEASVPVKPQHQRSPLISRFGDTAVKAQAQPEQPQATEEPIQPPQMHPAIAKVLQQTAPVAMQPKKQLSGSELKEQLIKERLAEVGHEPAKKQPKKLNWLSRQPRMVTILSSTLALLVLGGYLTYITLPSISLRVAASRAGVNASMPEYKPDGYSLDGPISYSPGAVIIGYKSNTNDSGFKLTQKSSNWDSQALLDNYVTNQTDNYLTFQERGITVYTFNNKAAWVNGGILYTIDGNASLSSDQVLRLATSL